MALSTLRAALAIDLPESLESDMAGAAREILKRIPRYFSQRGKFEELSRTWRAETSHISRLDMVYMHPAYQQIIGMGKDALPFIFEELAQPTGRWFWALKSITGFEPFAGQGGIPVSKMKEAWLEWGQQHGYTRSEGETGRHFFAPGGLRVRHQEQ